jgi:hypothetical protein
MVVHSYGHVTCSARDSSLRYSVMIISWCRSNFVLSHRTSAVPRSTGCSNKRIWILLAEFIYLSLMILTINSNYFSSQRTEGVIFGLFGCVRSELVISWPLKMEPRGCAGTSVSATPRCVTSQNSKGLVYTMMKGWNYPKCTSLERHWVSCEIRTELMERR